MGTQLKQSSGFMLNFGKGKLILQTKIKDIDQPLSIRPCLMFIVYILPKTKR